MVEQYVESDSRERLFDAMEQIGREFIESVATKYGTGYQDLTPPTIADLAYHNLVHTLDVGNNAPKLAQAAGMSDYDVALVRMNALAHDSTHEADDTRTAEEISADELAEKMRAAGFPEEDITYSRLAILATTPIRDVDGNFLGQMYKFMEFPSERAMVMARSLVAADTGAAFTANGPRAAHDVFKEEVLHLGALEAPATLQGLERFQERQLVFLENLQPLYEGADSDLGGLRQEGIAYHAALLDDLRAGRVTTWAQVEQMDTEYAQKWSAA